MSEHPSSQFDTKQMTQSQGASAKVSITTPSASNAANVTFARTEGSATVVESSVAPRSGMVYTELVAPRILTQGRSFQMIKMGI